MGAGLPLALGEQVSIRSTCRIGCPGGLGWNDNYCLVHPLVKIENAAIAFAHDHPHYNVLLLRFSNSDIYRRRRTVARSGVSPWRLS